VGCNSRSRTEETDRDKASPPLARCRIDASSAELTFLYSDGTMLMGFAGQGTPQLAFASRKLSILINRESLRALRRAGKGASEDGDRPPIVRLSYYEGTLNRPFEPFPRLPVPRFEALQGWESAV